MIFGDRKKYSEQNIFLTKEICPFCKIEEDEKPLLVHKTKYWEIRYNKYPYYGHKQNLLVFPIEHKIHTIELSDEELIDYKNIEIYMKDYFGERNYFSLIRQTTGGRSAEHLHYHYLEGILIHSKDDNTLFTVKNISKGEK
ncbi:MAG: hypothetical protein PHH98_04810 [Candidatus Gracilibacteria bacterium]|nr:hypothetical protein [Candidatus Gracilibacteria bacterium]